MSEATAAAAMGEDDKARGAIGHAEIAVDRHDVNIHSHGFMNRFARHACPQIPDG
jgi:hypothetical protein